VSPTNKRPDEIKNNWKSDFEKRKRTKSKNSVVLGGKPKYTFTGLEEGMRKSRRSVQNLRSVSCYDEIIHSGGALDVKNETEKSERIYCRLKGAFNLNALKWETKQKDWIPKNFKESFDKMSSVLQFTTCR